MANDSIATYLKYANLQMAAEAFLTWPDGEIKTGQYLINALKEGNHHPSKFTQVLAEDFVETWEVVAQQENTSSGFSGTLFRAKIKVEEQGIEVGDLVMSFRSTEYADDNLRDAHAGADGNIKNYGWAFV